MKPKLYAAGMMRGRPSLGVWATSPAEARRLVSPRYPLAVRHHLRIYVWPVKANDPLPWWVEIINEPGDTGAPRLF